MDPLVSRLRDREPAAFEEAWREHQPRLDRFLRGLGATPPIAEELVQEAFVRLAGNAPRLAPDTRLRSWLFTVCHNLWRSHRRWALLDGTRLLELAFAPASPSRAPDEAAAAGQSLARLQAALSKLPEGQRAVFALVALEGLEPSEAAEVLGLSPENARQRLSRARRQIEEELR